MTALPITNINKRERIIKYMENVLEDKRRLEEEFNNNYANFGSLFLDLSPRTDEQDKERFKAISRISNHLRSANFLSRTEVQKFVNDDLVKKKAENIKRMINRISDKEHFKTRDSKRKNAKVDKILFKLFKEKLCKAKYNRKPKVYRKHKQFFDSWIENKFKEIYTKKVEYNSGSIIKSDNRIGLGNSRVRLVFVPSNKLFKVFYCLDLVEQIGDKYVKTFINIPMAYNSKYHNETYLRALGTNKFNRGKPVESDDAYLAKMFNKDKIAVKDAKILYVREHMISLSGKGRLKIGLTYRENKEYKKIEIKEDNTIGIDLGGKIENTIAMSNNKFIPMEFLFGIAEKLTKADDLEDKTERDKQYKAISKEATYKMNEFIKHLLDEIASLKVSHIVMEKLDPWNVQWRDKSVDMKANRVFRLLRSAGFANLLRIQARNRNLRVHTLPAYYTSQKCPHCGHISRGNCKDERVFLCEECGHTDNRDFNAAKNLKLIMLDSERFSEELLEKNSEYKQEYSPKKFLKKELVKRVYSEIKQLKD